MINKARSKIILFCLMRQYISSCKTKSCQPHFDRMRLQNSNKGIRNIRAITITITAISTCSICVTIFLKAFAGGKYFIKPI